jgi:hypothetical protein
VKEILSKENIYRFGVAVKEFGERMGQKKILGIPALRWCCGPVISLGRAIRYVTAWLGGKANDVDGLDSNLGLYRVMSRYRSRRELFRLVK